MNKQQIIDKAESLATGIAVDPNKSIVIDSEMTAEDLLPLAFRHAYKELLSTGEISLQSVLIAHTIELTPVPLGSPIPGMSGPLPAGVLTEHLDQAFLPDYQWSNYERYLPDYIRATLPMICYWTVNNRTFYTTCVEADESGSEESSEESEEFDIVLHAPSVPAIPASPTDDIDIPTRARDHVIYTLAMALRGEIKLEV